MYWEGVFCTRTLSCSRLPQYFKFASFRFELITRIVNILFSSNSYQTVFCFSLKPHCSSHADKYLLNGTLYLFKENYPSNYYFFWRFWLVLRSLRYCKYLSIDNGLSCAIERKSCFAAARENLGCYQCSVRAQFGPCFVAAAFPQ